jgi:hypothetical protein
MPAWSQPLKLPGRRPQVDGEAIRKRMLDAYGIRVEPHMSEYVLRRLKQAGGALRELPVIGGEARTGMPVRMTVDLARLQRDMA